MILIWMIISCSERIMDHPSNAKRGGVCIYYKETLALKVISTPYLNESLLCEVTIGSRKCMIEALYRSSSQNSDQFESFLLNFEFLLQDISNHNPYQPKICAKDVSENVKAVQCDLCKLWIRIKCNNLNYSDYRYLQNSNESWYCIECCSTIFPFNSLSSNKNFPACCTNA